MKNWGYRNYEGIDISVSTVNYCKSIGLRCTLVEDTASWLGERSENFELITLLDVLEHIRKEDTIYFLKFLRKSLINGGKLIIQVPNLQSPDGQLHRYNDFTHEVGFTEHSMRQVLLVAGFDKFQFYGFESITSKSVRACIRTRLRNIFWQYIKITRTINGNLNPRILNPVLFSVVTK
jgi:cyclopropane fatty-acyl-phospholipid synthase-like methyltransferase